MRLLEVSGVEGAGGREGPPDYGVFPSDYGGLVWAISEGRRVPTRAVALHRDGSIRRVGLVRPPSLSSPPSVGAWEVPEADWDRVANSPVT